MRVVYTETDEPTMTFNGRELVLHVSRYEPAVAPTPLPADRIKREREKRTQLRLAAALNKFASRRGPDDWMIV